MNKLDYLRYPFLAKKIVLPQFSFDDDEEEDEEEIENEEIEEDED